MQAPFSTCFYCSIIFVSFVGGLSFGADSLSSGQSMKDGETLVSSGQSFELGFFSPGSSKSRYLGIWYKITPETVVWVANGGNPLTDSSGVLTSGHEGTLALLNQSKGVVWSSNSSGVLTNPVACLLESGNLVLWDNISSNPGDTYSWQSFDYPCDTLLSYMKLGSNLRTGFKWYLTAWKSVDDPSPSDYTCGLDDQGLPHIVILRNGSTRTYQSGVWNGVEFSGLSVAANSISRQMLVNNQTDVYFAYQAPGDGIITRVSLNESGSLQRLVRKKESASWIVMYSLPNDSCDNYALCGANGFCRSNLSSKCQCLQGFIPKSPEEWQMLYFSGGCMRKVPVNCSKGEGFFKLSRVSCLIWLTTD
ncbi:G-type lectin S-receptor-like serine/threonine-protein kinase At4g27290 [Rhodamnia argentea]|uniref:G-type lectin S-receptor-like serine/threonine-protein kinase At4g27290 n=1 Tax=Rhodamnia argentea TaxID=178133 RepID=A0ABM3H3D4_9MYRT|nr:G-type lectin S-receptor-like serine/threonine-protein kinase At4g27290 [Rhodamnia argentea]